MNSAGGSPPVADVAEGAGLLLSERLSAVKRGCCVGVVGLLALCLIACGAGYFLAIPRARDQIQGSVQHAISTEVAIQIRPSSGTPSPPGSYTITQQELQ